jgi:polyisoprenyl-phosphate glycosyltransferase
MKMISIVSGCFNEEHNVTPLYDQIRHIFSTLPQYRYELIFIDNCSTDATVDILKRIAKQDKNVKIIVNARNFGPDRSGNHAIRQAGGDAVIIMASDLQDPPSLIPQFITKWEEGYKIVLGTTADSEESRVMSTIRQLYYKLIDRLSETDQVRNANGFGLYDRVVIDAIKAFDDPLPYFRGLICEIGFERALVPFTKPLRTKGKSTNNFYSLYSAAMHGITSYSKIPLRMATMCGFAVAIMSFLVAVVYLIYKLIYWNSFSIGIAPIIIGMSFLASVQLIFIGILGEYIGSIYTQVQRRPFVIERERINFE